MSQLENSMVVGDYYEEGMPEYAHCKGCLASVDVETLVRGYCADCRTCCALCEDWNMGKQLMRDEQGREVHVTCYADDVLSAMYDALGVQ